MFVTNHCIKFWSRRFIFNVLRVADPRALLSPVAQITGRDSASVIVIGHIGIPV